MSIGPHIVLLAAADGTRSRNVLDNLYIHELLITHERLRDEIIVLDSLLVIELMANASKPAFGPEDEEWDGATNEPKQPLRAVYLFRHRENIITSK